MGTQQQGQDWSFQIGNNQYDLQDADQMQQVLNHMIQQQVTLEQQLQLAQQPPAPPIVQAAGLTNDQINALATAINPQ